jgi:hypothetical protein
VAARGKGWRLYCRGGVGAAPKIKKGMDWGREENGVRAMIDLVSYF